MAREFRTEIRVYFGDTDGMGVASHTNYIRWFEVARTELLRELGFTYLELEKVPLWTPLSQVHCEYKLPAYFDDVVEVVSHIAELGHASAKVGYEIRRMPGGELLATGYTCHVFTDDKLKPVSLKKTFLPLYEALRGIVE
ncbi:MAG: acyl-CoA thioesterase [Clostridiales bacterium]|nr:acyl-CoA thioesterase [Clostridiales bacterium]